MSFFNRINLDLAGGIASFICALHCIAVPIIFSIGAANSYHFLHNHNFDIVIVLLGLVIAWTSLRSDYKVHQSKTPFILVIIGFSILVLGLRLGHDLIHALVSVLGSCFVITAHYYNWKMTRGIK
jgi:cell division protein FtsW (lipid II flippase)